MPLGDQVLRARLARDPWTAYNIRLSPGLTTMGDKPEFLKADPRLQAILRTLTILFPKGLSGLRMADLGCLEGAFSLALARRGADVLGLDARQTNLDKGLLLKEHFELANLEFALGDVKEFTRDRYGVWDAVLAVGIVYHLDRPVEWIAQIGAATRSVLIIDGHLAPPDEASLAKLDSSLARLGGLEHADVGGRRYEGRWFQEVPHGRDLAGELWAAASNERSFWLTKASMLMALSCAGFDVVMEQYDWMIEQYPAYSTGLSRSMFIAAKSSAFDREARASQ